MIWSFYDPETGLFTGRRFRGSSEGDLALNLPDGLTAIEGAHDHLCRKVNLKTGNVVDHKPPQPDNDHAWDEAVKRWVLKPDVARKQAERAQAQRRITELELQQLRPLRGLMIDPDNAEERQRLDEIEAEINGLRGLL